ncbi:MAG: TIGR04283 family arsenosugar biosynthesis glycosyltransferase [Candidatus Wallbacteria bacterium]|nr:TIGR04283 family arsenosugar biosynthesis glycosyltransferase [Candidatus Wallbacteria bacterium]
MVSIVIPVLDEAGLAGECLDRLEAWCPRHEVIVADGGSSDATLQAVERRPWARLVRGPRGRGAQMNAGAREANHDTLLFLHADLTLPPDAPALVEKAMADPGFVGGGFLKSYGPAPLPLKALEWALNEIRSRWLQDLVGTNAIFVRTEVFRRLGGYREWPLLEDVDLCDRLKEQGRLAILDGPVEVSPRKYLADGPLTRTWVNARVMFGHRVLGTSPAALARIYRRGPRAVRGAEPSVSVIVPALDEEATLARCLEMAAGRPGVEVIVADGGSTDGTEAVAGRFPGTRFLRCPERGRAAQMNAGAQAATGRILAFLHADTVLPEDAFARIRGVFEPADGPEPIAGAFEIGLDAEGWEYRLIETISNARNRWRSTPYGDQCLFLRRETFEAAGGFPRHPFLEDVALALALNRLGAIVFLPPPGVRTSARRFERHGPLLTAGRNAILAALYRWGVGAGTLKRWYDGLQGRAG